MENRHFSIRWARAVSALQSQAARLFLTARNLPIELTAQGERSPPARAAEALGDHISAFSDYTAALTCLEALVREHDGI